ncbi:MAG: DUF4249 family protein [Bacteroidota bacterium]
MRQLLKLFLKHPATWLIVIFLIQCESNDRYYRPDVPEQLCAVGIIDIDDTASTSTLYPLRDQSNLRHLSFEKSYQSEFPEDAANSLREFEFTISSANEELFRYFCDSTQNKIIDLRIPDSIVFYPGEKYSLKAKERSVQEIYAETVAPESPSTPEFISFSKGRAVVTKPTNACNQDSNARYVMIRFSFEKEQNMYYALMVDGWGFSTSSTYVPFPGFLDFSINESNTPGFFSEMQGLKMYRYVCTGQTRLIEALHATSYLIEGENIPDTECVMTIYIRYWDLYCPYDVFKSIRIRLMSIPGELYSFEKSIYAYRKTSGDPFVEPIYTGGNIRRGYGIFALCRSTELVMNFSPWI